MSEYSTPGAWPRIKPTALQSVITQSRMIQRLPIRGPTAPGCSSITGGAQFAAECMKWKPSIVMHLSPAIVGMNRLSRTLISASPALGSADPKLASIVVLVPSVSQNQVPAASATCS